MTDWQLGVPDATGDWRLADAAEVVAYLVSSVSNCISYSFHISSWPVLRLRLWSPSDCRRPRLCYAMLWPFCLRRGYLHTGSRAGLRWSFGNYAPILSRAIQVSVNLPCAKAGELVGVLDAKIAWEMEDTPARPPHLTPWHFEEKCLHQMQNYLFKCLETIFGQ